MFGILRRIWDLRLATPSNFITATRIFPMAPLVFWLLIEGRMLFAALVIAVAGVSDWLDGYIARLLKQETLFGRMFDPLADKVFVDIALFGFWVTGLLSWIWVVVLVTVAYDIRMTYLRWPDFLKALDSPEAESKLSPSGYGKLKTAVQFLAMGILLANGVHPWLSHIGQTLLASTLILVAINWISSEYKAKAA